MEATVRAEEGGQAWSVEARRGGVHACAIAVSMPLMACLAGMGMSWPGLTRGGFGQGKVLA